jgi:hypothetical protein
MSDKPTDGVTPIATEAGDERFIAPFSDNSGFSDMSCCQTDLQSAESGKSPSPRATSTIRGSRDG